MKFIHTADWHLGKLLKEHSMTEDQAWLLEHRFLSLLDEENRTSSFWQAMYTTGPIRRKKRWSFLTG